ncbi:MAG: hypothetical protein QM747_05805 [Nocardioides sp.]
MRVVLARPDAAPVTRSVPSDQVDDILREALADGWSVREVSRNEQAGR